MPASDPANTMPQTRAALDRLDDLTLQYPGPKAFGKGTVIAWINLSTADQSAALDSLEAFAALLTQTSRAKWPTLANYIQTKRWQYLPASEPAIKIKGITIGNGRDTLAAYMLEKVPA